MPATSPKKTPKPAEQAPCWLCSENCDKDDNFCAGCKQVVCEKCCTAEDQPMGRHDPIEHRDPRDDDDDEES